MTVITINGQIGAAGHEIGAMVARRLQLDYVDRLILAEAAKRLGTTVAALAEKEQRVRSLGERIARFLQTLMERSAVAGAGADPYFDPGIGVLLGQDYPHVMEEPITQADQVEDESFIEATKAVIQEMADEGNAVIIGRASNIILKDHASAFHVALVSSDMESRARVIGNRQGISLEEAERIVNEHEKARVDYFRRYFKASADDPLISHMTLNIHLLGQERAAEIIVQAAPV